MFSSFSARFTPSHAAALNDRSFFPPMSKTMPTRVVQPTRSASACVPHDAVKSRPMNNAAVAIAGLLKETDNHFILIRCVIRVQISADLSKISAEIHYFFLFLFFRGQPLSETIEEVEKEEAKNESRRHSI